MRKEILMCENKLRVNRGAILRSISFMIMMFWSFGWGGVSSGENVDNSRTVVASVNNVPILREDIEDQMGEASRGNDSGGSLKRREMREGKLFAKIKTIIFEQQIKAFEITASESEVDDRINEIIAQTHITDDVAAAMCQKMQALKSALLEYYNSPGLEDAIYLKNLKPLGVSEFEWDQFKANYNTLKRIQAMVVPENLSDMKSNSRASARKDILYDKLMKKVSGEVTVSPLEIKDFYEKSYKGRNEEKGFAETLDEIVGELLVQKRRKCEGQWWSRMLFEADIKAVDPSYIDMIDRLKARVGEFENGS